MHVLFVHGWSVADTETYGHLPRWLAQQAGPDGRALAVGDIYLGQYISFDDTITLDDIARAFDQAVRDALGAKLNRGEKFACVTHSTGGPVVRQWLNLYWKDRLSGCPMRQFVMLAPANHGSALAQLGKSRLGRIHSFFQGAEPGRQVLDWLELGSEGQRRLNADWLDYDCVRHGLYPFVLTGQAIDRRFYDVLNTYTGEAGSDGVVRVAAANLNYRLLRLEEDAGVLKTGSVRRSRPIAFGILPGCAHSGEKMGILRSITRLNADRHPGARWVLRCLQVNGPTAYRRLSRELESLSEQTQADERVGRVRLAAGLRTFRNDRHSMLVFRFMDDRGHALDDYDLYLTAGSAYSEDALPHGFFRDRQRNRLTPGVLTYYLNYDVMAAGLSRGNMGGRLGLRVRARPEEDPNHPRLVFYRPLEFRGAKATLRAMIAPNETTLVEIRLRRQVDARVFRLTDQLEPGPIEPEPLGCTVI